MAGHVPSPAPADPARRGVPGAPTALYRRYRPATFAELKGQDHVTEPLRQALRSGRVHHAYLFSGPRGCGKTSSARILARSLNCEQGPTPDPCGKCASCVALAPSGPGSIDVIEIDAASHGGVDDARDLRERAFYAPVSGRFKIYIVDEAHMVTREGFNALLKLVEEPPSHLKFVFATTEPEKVIPTIRSRTHHYPFRLMPPAILRGLLEEILGNEGVSYEPAVLPVVIRAGAGSARDALSVLDQLLAGSGDSGLTYERAVALLGYTDDSLLDEVAEAFAAGDGAAVFRAVDRVVEAGHDPRRFAADLLDRFRDLIVLAAVPDAAETGLLDVPADRLDRMREQAGRFGQAQLARAAQTISAGLVDMRGATSPRLQLELICAQVLLPGVPALAAPVGGEQDLLARLERLERRLGSPGGDAGHGAEGAGHAARSPVASPSPPAQRPSTAASPARTPPAARAPAAGAPAPEAESAAPDIPRDHVPGRSASASAGAGAPDANSVRERWPAILDAVKGKRRVAWILLSNATVDTLQDNVLTLRFTNGGEAKGFSGSDCDQDLGQVLETMLGISPRIRAVSGPGQGGRPGVGVGAGGVGVGGGAAGGPGADADPPRGPTVGGGASAGSRAGAGAPGGSTGGGSASGAGGDAPGGSAAGGSVAGARGNDDEAGVGRSGSGGGRSGSGGGRSGSGGGRSRAGAGRGGARAAGTGASRGAPGDGGDAQGGAGGDVPAGAGGEVPDRANGAGGPAGRADAGTSVEALTGMDLIRHTLGGEVIEEIGDA
ncbi:MAG TPA: DNA polymerase III subunit gamma and tau [Streptosporangiaceae bacterium]|nr:DNA polymerase III subunit gamma and tau [Streptosporangiaceae bacterium]